MATSKIALTEGTGKNAATYSVSEDAVTKEVQRVSLNTSGGSEAGTSGNPMVVDLGTNNDVTVTGTIDLGATDNAVLDTIATNTGASLTDTELRATPVPVSGSVTVDMGANNDVTITSSALPTGASTAANQTTIIGHVDGIETLLGTIDADTSKIPALGQALEAASVPVVLPAAQLTTLTPPAAITGFATSAKQDTIIAAIDGLEGSVDGVEALLTTIDADTSRIPTLGQAAMAASTPVVLASNQTSIPVAATLTAETTKVIGTVNVAAAQTIAVTNAGTFATQATLQAGSAAIGKLAANSGVDIGDVDVTSLPAIPAGTNTIGKVAPNEYELAGNTTHVKKYYTNTGAATDGIIWSPAAGKRWYVTDIFIQVSAAATVTLEDDLTAGDSAIWKAELAANGGWTHSFTTPLFSGEDAADLLITTTAGNVYVTCTGYEI
jgi:hypothetical protein